MTAFWTTTTDDERTWPPVKNDLLLVYFIGRHIGPAKGWHELARLGARFNWAYWPGEDG